MITKRSLFSWILRRHWPVQFLLLTIIMASIFFRVIPVELQKRIINVAIQLKKTDLLFLYCGLYIAAVILFSALKYAINMLQSYTGQKILVEMRNELYEHILTLPLQFFRKTQPGTVMTSLTSELNTVGAFLGGALAIPVASVLTLLTFTGYMIFLDPKLALLSLALYPLEILLIPYLQHRYNRLNSARVDETRSMSNAINESISGIHEIQGNASYRLEMERLGHFIDRLFSLMNRMFLYKFGTKFVNNIFQNMGPFILFLVGGYLTIQGQLTLGALVAFISAFEKIYDPCKELIDYYEEFQDARVRYNRVMECFDVEPEFELSPTGRPVHQVKGKIEAKHLGYTLENGVHLLDDVSFRLRPGELMALVGASGSGKSTLSMVLGQLYRYNRGQVLLDGHELRQLTKMDISCNIGFVSQHPFIFNGTVRDNILYGSRALFVANDEGGARSLPDRNKVLEMLQTVGLAHDVMRFGLNTIIPIEKCEHLAKDFIRMRLLVSNTFGEKLAEVVEPYDVNNFLHYSSIYDNLFFSDVHRTDYLLENLPFNRTFLKFLTDTNLDTPLTQLGKDLAQQTVALLMGIGENNESFSAKIPIKPEHIEIYKTIGNHLHLGRPRMLGKEEKALLLRLALEFVPARHKTAVIPLSLQENIVRARQHFIRDVVGVELATCSNPIESIDETQLNQTEQKGFSPHCSAKYLYSHTLLDNLVYGNLKEEQNSARAELVEQITDLLTEKHLDEVMDAGLDFQVGSKGDRLSGGQQQKIAIARVLLKEPPILIMDEVTASLDNASQARIQRFIETQIKGKTTVVAVMHRLDMIPSYDKILVLRAGRVLESGTYEELMEQKGVFYELVQIAR